MISRKTAMAITMAYMAKFSYVGISSRPSGEVIEKVKIDELYDFLYEHNYEAWFCNMVKKILWVRQLKDWFLQIHTGESLAAATPNWAWDQRQTLGQTYLKNLARDYILWFHTLTKQGEILLYKQKHDEMVRHLEMDGYVFRDDDLYQAEVEVLDVEQEKGLLENLHKSIGLTDYQQTFDFLKLAEDHYVAGRWSDCIGNARKFFEAILQQVASKHSTELKKTPLAVATLERPVAIREYLEKECLLEKKEREAVDKIYGLLSHTGNHPYMAEKDQARLLRQITLTMTQFIMLRLEGALKPP